MSIERLLLIGNPNTGKTSLLNSLTKSDEHVGNWHGVTVSQNSKFFSHNNKLYELVDLPGIYSLSALSFEEQVTINYLLENKESTVINICDQDNLQRNLYLTLQLIELGVKVVLVINKMSKDKNLYTKVDIDKLSKVFNIEVVNVNVNSKKCKNAIMNSVSNAVKSNIKLTYLENFPLEKITLNIKQTAILKNLDPKWCALKLLERDEEIKNKLNLKGDEALFVHIKNDDFKAIAKYRIDYIKSLTKNSLIISEKVYGFSKIDKLLLNKIIAFPLFLLIMLAVFYVTFFSLGSFISGILENLFLNVIGMPFINFLIRLNSPIWVVDLFAVGIIGGIGTLLTFLPQVVLLFFFLSIIEDSGYLSRIAFLFDDFLAKVGLSGKSVYTLLMGYGCITTACLTSRNMEDKNSQIKTAVISPYISCSAKLPVYTVLGSTFFGVNNVFIILFLYILSFVVAVFIAFILDKTYLKSKSQSFILEFPNYKLPSLKRLLKIVYNNFKLFLIRIGSLLISMNIIVWVLQSFSFDLSYVSITGKNSIIQGLGTIIAPIFYPLGFNNWGAVSALVAGFIAKEVIVSSIGIFNGFGADITESSDNLHISLKNPNSAVFFTSGSCFSYLIFCLLYSPCLATTAVLFKEIGKKWTYFTLISQFIVAYLITFVLYMLYKAFVTYNFLTVLITIISIFLILLSIIFIIRKVKKKKLCHNCIGCHNNNCHKQG